MPRKTNALLDSFGTLRPYQPTLRERGVNALRQALFSDDRVGQDQAENLMSYLDYTPVGAATAMYDAGRSGAEGDYLGAGLNTAMAGLPAAKIRPAVDNVQNLLRATFKHGRVVGDQTLPLSKMTGGVNLTNPLEKARVDDLAARINSPEGYFSRLVADTEGNVLEGQHRLEALRQLGIDEIPATVVQDIGAGHNTTAAADAVKAVGGVHQDQANQIVDHALEMLSESGSADAAMQEFELPRGLEKHFAAALRALGGS